MLPFRNAQRHSQLGLKRHPRADDSTIKAPASKQFFYQLHAAWRCRQAGAAQQTAAPGLLPPCFQQRD